MLRLNSRGTDAYDFTGELLVISITGLAHTFGTRWRPQCGILPGSGVLTSNRSISAYFSPGWFY